MNPINKKAPQASIAPRQTPHTAVLQRKEAFTHRVARPVAPPVYRPQPQSGVAQTRMAQPVQGVRQPVAPPVYTPPAAAGSGVQLAKKGAKGGKSGLTYTSIGGTYNQDQIGRAMTKAKVKGVKGHRKGNTNSGVSGQTKHETKKVVKALREIREEERTKLRGCRQFHKRRNVGRLCIHCGRYVT